ncbi:MAG: hypothetical protein R3A44_02970 [Caldilineaceae bacterium]
MTLAETIPASLAMLQQHMATKLKRLTSSCCEIKCYRQEREDAQRKPGEKSARIFAPFAVGKNVSQQKLTTQASPEHPTCIGNAEGNGCVVALFIERKWYAAVEKGVATKGEAVKE